MYNKGDICIIKGNYLLNNRQFFVYFVAAPRHKEGAATRDLQVTLIYENHNNQISLVSRYSLQSPSENSLDPSGYEP